MHPCESRCDAKRRRSSRERVVDSASTSKVNVLAGVRLEDCDYRRRAIRETNYRNTMDYLSLSIDRI